MQVGIIELKSSIADLEFVRQQTKTTMQVINSLPFIESVLINEEQTEEVDIVLFNVLTGGSEMHFKELLPKVNSPIFLLAHPLFNSLAACLEMMTYAMSQGIKVTLIHGDDEEIKKDFEKLNQCIRAISLLKGMKIGMFGFPSDWLIASSSGKEIIANKLGVEWTYIPLESLYKAIDKARNEYMPNEKVFMSLFKDEKVLNQAKKIYLGIRNIIDEKGLSAFAIRCFDLLLKYDNTPCLALSTLNEQGIIAACEGDIGALVTLVVARLLTKQNGFQANVAKIDRKTNTAILAHCQVPLDMVESYKLLTHFESGKGIGVRGEFRVGVGTLVKISPSLDRYYISKIRILENLSDENYCRTQIRVKLDKPVSYFYENPIANHHIVLLGDHVREFEWFMEMIID